MYIWSFFFKLNILGAKFSHNKNYDCELEKLVIHLKEWSVLSQMCFSFLSVLCSQMLLIVCRLTT